MRIRTLAFAAALLATAAPSGAKTLCGQIGDPDGRFYVIFKLKTKVGTIAPVHGYFITPAGLGTPFSGHFSVLPGGDIFLTTSDGSGEGGFGSRTHLRNWSAPLSPAAADGQFYGTEVDGSATFLIPPTTTSFADCKNVPKYGIQK